MCARRCGQCAARGVECTRGGNCTAMMSIATFRGGSTGCISTGGCGGDIGSASCGITDISNSGGDCATGGLTVCVRYTTVWCRWERLELLWLTQGHNILRHQRSCNGVQ